MRPYPQSCKPTIDIIILVSNIIIFTNVYVLEPNFAIL